MADGDGRGTRRGNKPGFTLIELLIVVAIIGLIAAVAMPNLQSAMERGRQKRTMADMKALGSAFEMYSIDHNIYPPGLTDADAGTVGPYLSPMYIQRVPPRDGWNNRWHIETSANGIVYTIVSYGRDGSPGDSPGGPTTDPRCDIIFSNNSFFQWPEGAQQ
jgi:general secretion pathway protein G